jgi:hypothetical protein
VKFFFDNNLAVKVAHGLDQMVRPEHRVVHLRDEFLPNVEDAVWMKALVKEEDLVIVTADVAISRNRTREQVHEMLPGNHQRGHALGTQRGIHRKSKRQDRIAEIAATLYE